MKKKPISFGLNCPLEQKDNIHLWDIVGVSVDDYYKYAIVTNKYITDDGVLKVRLYQVESEDISERDLANIKQQAALGKV